MDHVISKFGCKANRSSEGVEQRRVAHEDDTLIELDQTNQWER